MRPPRPSPRWPRSNELVVTHGNGPQVGVLALESAADPALTHPYPFDVLVAETQGLIGNWLIGAVERASPRPVRCASSPVRWSRRRPGLRRPDEVRGPDYTRGQAETLAAARGWQVRQDGSELAHVWWHHPTPSTSSRCPDRVCCSSTVTS